MSDHSLSSLGIGVFFNFCSTFAVIIIIISISTHMFIRINLYIDLTTKRKSVNKTIEIDP